MLYLVFLNNNVQFGAQILIHYYNLQYFPYEWNKYVVISVYWDYY